MTENFSDRLIHNIEDTKSRVCCGIDPRIKEVELTYDPNAKYWIPESLVQEQIKKHGKIDGMAKAVEIFCKKLVQAVDDHVAIYKPNIAYFESLGPKGLITLKNVLDFIHENTDKMVIIDSKRGDIGTTSLHYGIGLFERFGFDASTINPYLGIDGIKPFLKNFVGKKGKGVFILCKTSNPSSGDFQDKMIGDKTLFNVVANKIVEWGKEYIGERGYSSVGAVVGATYPEQLKNLRKVFSQNPLLIPGLGIQGGNAEDVARLGTNSDGFGAIFNSSRGINFAYQRMDGFSEDNWIDASRLSAKNLKEQINKSIKISTVNMKKVQDEFLDVLLKKGALRIAPNLNELFVFKSGRKSPNFINIGALTDGESLEKLKQSLAHFIASLVKNGEIEDFDFIYGPAYKAINLAALACAGLSELYGMNKRYLYDRKEIKDYGDVRADKVIVGSGYFKPSGKILIIDDVITTGGTKVEAINKLKVLGDHKIVGLVLVVDRQEKMGDVEKVEDKSAVEYIQDKFGVKVFPFLSMKTIFGIVKNNLSNEIKQNWIDYYRKYGVVELK